MARRTFSTALLLVAGGCYGAPSAPSGGGDVGNCERYCPPHYTCESGVVMRYPLRIYQCWEAWPGLCPSFPASTSEVMCREGCREGATHPVASALCEENQPAQVGDPCAMDVDCSPGGFSGPDGFGGTSSIPLVCGPAGACALALVERCNAEDEDADGAVDEGCVARPRVLASGEGVVRRVAYGMDRIALLVGETTTATVTILDGEGAIVVRTAPIAHAVDVVRGGAGFAVLTHAPLDRTAFVLVLDDAGTELGRIPLPVPAGVRGVDTLAVFGDRWLLERADGPSSMRLQLHDAAGALLREVAYALDPITLVPFAAVPLEDPEALLVFPDRGADFLRWRLDEGLAITPLTDVRLGVRTANHASIPGSIVSLSEGSPTPQLVFFDAETALLERTVAVTLPFPLRPTLAADGDDIVISWHDPGTLRSVVLDPAGARLAVAELSVDFADPVFFAGEVPSPRLVLAGDGRWLLVAQADR